MEKHYINRVGWLRAGVLGANDGILSTTSLVIGVASASSDHHTIILAALSGLIGGAMSMAAGEYISVSSQLDTENADVEREKKELEDMPDVELKELAGIYEARGLAKDLAMEVASQLTRHNALEAHLRDELGMSDMSSAKPMQAAVSSFGSFVVGASLPMVVAVVAPLQYMVYIQYCASIFFLMALGAVAANAGGAPVVKSVTRICFWGTIAMVFTALVGHLFGTSIA